MNKSNSNQFSEYLFSYLFAIDSFLLGFRAVFEYSNIKSFAFLSLIPAFVWGTILLIIFFQKYTLKELFISFCLIVIGLQIYRVAKTTIPLFSMLFLLGARHKSNRKIIFWNFLGVLLAYIFIVGLGCIGAIRSSIYPDGSISLGFKNPNLLSFYSTLLVIFILYLCFYKLNYQQYFLLFCFTFSMGLISKSRTGLLMAVLMILCALCLRKYTKVRVLFFKYIKFVLISIVLICGFGIIFCQVIPFLTKIDSILSGRFRLAQIYIAVYGITPFGSVIDSINDMGYGHLVLDNGYARLLVQFGLVYFFVFLSLFLFSASHFCKNQDTKSLLLIFAVFIGLVSETHWIPINTNIMICLCSVVVFPIVKNTVRKNKSFCYYFLKFEPKRG